MADIFVFVFDLMRILSDQLAFRTISVEDLSLYFFISIQVLRDDSGILSLEWISWRGFRWFVVGRSACVL